MPGRADPDAIPSVYERAAEGFDRRRSRALAERVWLERFAALVPPGGAVLDLGCGGGEPIAAWLMARGLRVTGLDVAEPMLALCRRRWPDGEWIRADMRALALSRRFHGVVAWDSLFHLAPAAQRGTIARIAEHLQPGGAFLFTSGPDAGEPTGCVEGHPVHHASLTPAGYAAALEAHGLLPCAFVAEDPGCDGRSVWLARRR